MTTTQSLSHTVLWTALITPMLEDGGIDFDGLSALAQEQAAAGNGVLILGSTGEALALDVAEQQAVVKHICALELNTPIMVGVGGYNLEAQRQWLAFCNDYPIDAYLLGAPLYAKPGPVGQEQWFRALLDASEHPCMLYNVPGRAAVSLDPQVLGKLQDHPLCWALKEASGSIDCFEQYRLAAPELAIFSGDDALIPYYAQAGAAGLVSVAANVWPEATHRFVQLSLQGQSHNAFLHWREAVAALFHVSNPIPSKCLLHALGRITYPTLRAPLTHAEVDDLHLLLRVHDSITSWHSTQV
ncbi:4-hydroxy-tetrahydrodipicolinate synthase [Pseudoalteromonas sp. T1lg48]|uniref:4-hydroxy-tetrahydrodipicolinate synthase n=1 Tax=Pseudoalteromonas sp. T1lg48 TaxID=2077100 RepID=UPI000CF66684|nr:4-hydroxy-tetrahydrodipicolinate synthase [Pseudoalteromonas sp. T1lg48]